MVNWVIVGYGFFTFVFLIIATIILYQVFKRGHNFKVRIKVLTSDNTKVVKDYVGKIKRDKSGILYLKIFFGLKHLIRKPMPAKAPVPPAEVRDIDSGGKFSVQMWYDDIRGYTYSRDGVNINTLEKLKDTEGFKPFPTYHREMMVNDLLKKDAYKKKPLGEVIMYMTPFVALLMILTIFLIFYGKAVGPITTAADNLAAKEIELGEIQLQIASELNTQMRNLDAIKNDKPLTQNVPPEGA